MKKFKIKTGDTVKVIAGDHKDRKVKFYRLSRIKIES